MTRVNPNNSIVQNIGYSTLINTFLPFGCWVGGFLMDKIGRKQTMTLGFILQGILGFGLGGGMATVQKSTAGLIIYYGVFLATAEMGPGVATILVAGEVYPTPLRGHMLGFSAAWGKTGAAIGTQVFTPIQNAFSSEFKGQQTVFLIGSAVSILGGILTWCLIPNMDKTLGSEDDRWKAYLKAHGIDTTNMGEPIEASASKKVRSEIHDTNGQEET